MSLLNGSSSKNNEKTHGHHWNWTIIKQQCNEMYEHQCIENINNLYKPAGKCDDQQQYKAIIEAEMV